MPRRRSLPPPDPRLVALASKQADELVELLDREGLPLDVATASQYAPLLAAALEHIVLARCRVAEVARKAKRQELLDRQAAWAAAHHLGTRAETLTQLGLSDKQLRAARALGIVAEVNLPHELREGQESFFRGEYYPLCDLTPEERMAIDQATLLTRLQAAAWLGISPAAFDTRRKKVGLRPADTMPGASGWAANLYRLSEIRRLVEYGAAED